MPRSQTRWLGQPAMSCAAIEDAPAGRAVDAGDGADERGLAGPVGTDDGDDGAFLDLQRDAVERLGVAVKQIERFDREDHAGASTPR